MNSRKLTICVFGSIVFLCAISGWAQSSGSIDGVVKDSTGGVLASATVGVARHAELGVEVAHRSRSLTTREVCSTRASTFS